VIISRQSAGASRYDAIVIGAGHNGLTCACYLARAGLKVGIFERRTVIGGAAVTEEFHPGYRNSTASYTVSLLHSKVLRELRLAEHGLSIVERPMQNFLPLQDGSAFCAGPRQADTLAEVRRRSPADAERLPAFYAMLERTVAYLRSLLLKTPPAGIHRLNDLMSLLSMGRELRRLPADAQREVHELFTRSAGDVLDGWFESDALKALHGFDAIVGAFQSPYTPTSAYVLLHHAFGETNGKPGVWGHAIGGMGSITQAMAKEAARLGVQIHTDTPVTAVITDRARGDRLAATGIALADGRHIAAGIVAANVNPKILFLKLLDPSALPADFRDRVAHYRCESATFRMNVALSELPSFSALPGTGPHLGSGIIIAPSLSYMERAYFDARTAGWSRAPIIEMLIPSTLDSSLAPAGGHVASLFCQHFARTLPEGRTWSDARESVADMILDTVTAYAPNFRRSVIGRLILSPADLEERFALTGGDIFHGALGLDQLWAARPVLGYGNYRTPVAGLYLCGAGAHPGGGVTGLPGHNAAREVLRDRRATLRSPWRTPS
jgi:phytoene dehydrogenase-like protein